MIEIDERLERLICRSLDGELGDDEQLALDRELMRNPQARALMADYAANDQLFAKALDRALTETPVAPALRTVSIPTRRWGSTIRWIVPGAIAAALLATVIPHPPLETKPPDQQIVATAPMPTSPRANMDQTAPIRTVSSNGHALPSVSRDKGREIIGVVGDDGNLYWIEVERTRTVKRPSGAGDATRFGHQF